jgi:hypothetical protein
VIHEHEALELASASLDFPLSPEEQRELDAALADCEICAERAAAYRSQQRLMTQIPAFEVSELTQRRIRKAAVAGRVDGRPPMLLLAAALLLALTLAMVAGVGALLNRQQQTPDLGVTEPSSSPAASVQPSPAPSTPAPVASPSPVVVGAIPPDSIVKVVSDNLRVRSAPRVADDSIKLEPLLKVGDRLFVVGGPVVANDYEWYEVAPVNIDGKRPWFTLPSGWVARGDHDGTPWVAAAEPRCPAEPVDIDALAAMHELERLACFGSGSLSFRAVVRGEGPPTACDASADQGPCVAGPDWLAGVLGWQAYNGTGVDTGSPTSGPSLTVDPAGSVRPSDLPNGRIVAVEGSFDHPASAECTAGAAPSGQAALTSEAAELQCRTRFVVTKAIPAPNYLVPGTAAVTVSNNVRVRSLPVVSDASERLTPLLKKGTRVFVLQGPVIGSGYDWYEVVVPSVTKGPGPMVGWVSVADKTGESWLAPAKIDCPTAEGITVGQLAALVGDPPTDAGLSCFGGRALRFQAHVDTICDDSVTRTLPGWLAAENQSLRLHDGDVGFVAKPHPDVTDLPDCVVSTVQYMVEGQFDHPDAAECSANPEAPGKPVDDRVALYQCRTRFVVTKLTPVTP